MAPISDFISSFDSRGQTFCRFYYNVLSSLLIDPYYEH